MWNGILAKIRPEPLKASLAPKGPESKPEPLTAHGTLQAAARIGDISDSKPPNRPV
jgi:hypothetical protein